MFKKIEVQILNADLYEVKLDFFPSSLKGPYIYGKSDFKDLSNIFE